MTNERTGEKIELEPNSKPYLLKRIISDGFDTVLILVIFMLLSMLIFSSPLAKTYNDHVGNCQKAQEETANQYGEDNEAAAKALRENEYYQNEHFAAELHGYLLKLLAGALAEAVVLLAVPLFSKNRMTPGKILMGIMPFCQRKQTKASRLVIFARFSFVLIIDSAFFYLFTGIFTFLLIPVIRLIEMLLNKKNRTVCDVLTGVTIIEKLSYNGIDSI